MELELPVFKRLSTDFADLHEQFEEAGFKHTGEALNGKVHYHESAGIGITLVEGPLGGTLVFPSGPVRGFIYGENSVRSGDARPRIIQEEDADGDGESNGRSDYDEIVA